jgi:hypothetical protein
MEYSGGSIFKITVVISKLYSVVSVPPGVILKNVPATTGPPVLRGRAVLVVP